MTTAARSAPPIVYPESDGKPMAENTRQYLWITTFHANLTEVCRADGPSPGFVAADNFIYPVEGQTDLCVAPDVYVALGRPPGHRGSYRVWEEGGVFPQVVVEILSPSNVESDMDDKREFYRRYGASEYYIYDPDTDDLVVWVRVGNRLARVDNPNGWVSPLLGIRFDTSGSELAVYHPNRQPFLTVAESRARSDAERQRADAERQRADAERQRADAERQRADAAQTRADELAAKLRALGLDPDAP